MTTTQIQKAKKVCCEICGKPPSPYPYPNGLFSHGHVYHVECLATAYQELKSETRHVITALQKATNELMTEFISKKRAANWQIINEAGVSAQKLLAQLTTE